SPSTRCGEEITSFPRSNASSRLPNSSRRSVTGPSDKHALSANNNLCLFRNLPATYRRRWQAPNTRPERISHDVRARPGGSPACGNAHIGSDVLGSRDPADEWNGHGGCDRARFVRKLHRLLGADDGGDDVAGRGAGGREARSSPIDAAVRRL